MQSYDYSKLFAFTAIASSSFEYFISWFLHTVVFECTSRQFPPRDNGSFPTAFPSLRLLCNLPAKTSFRIRDIRVVPLKKPLCEIML